MVIRTYEKVSNHNDCHEHQNEGQHQSLRDNTVCAHKGGTAMIENQK
jgi:hypothetical protein